MAARLRLTKFEASTPALLRLTRVRASGTAPGPPRLRTTRIRASGAVDEDPRLRLTRIRAAGVVAVVLDPIVLPTASPVEPDQIHTVSVDVAVGSPVPDSIEWSITPSSVGIESLDGVAWFRAPSALPPGTSVTVSARGVLGGVQGPMRSLVIPVLPQTRWSRDPVTKQWVGASRLS